MDVSATTMRIITSGIAERMLMESGQGHLPDTPEGCQFWVESEHDPLSGEEVQSVVVQFPPLGHRQAFGARRGAPFGTPGCPPLSDGQMDLIEQMLAELTAESAH